MLSFRSCLLLAGAALLLGLSGLAFTAEDAASPIHFALSPVPFTLENDETPARNPPESMAGGVAVFDYNRDGRPDIFFTNGANLATLQKDNPKYRNRLFRNEGNGRYSDVTDAAGLAGHGYDVGAAAADYDNDGYPDLFVAGVHRNTLYHNNGDGTFSDVTGKAGLDHDVDAQFGPLWSVAAAWVDVNNDGLLDLFIVNYVQWKYSDKAACSYLGQPDYCHPKFFNPLPNQLFLNRGNGHFEDVSKAWGIRSHPGKGMGVGVADYDGDGRPDLFITNDGFYNSLFHNTGGRFEEVAMSAGAALPEDGNFISGMGLDFRDFNNDGLPDIAYIALNNQTFPMLRNSGKGNFEDVTAASGMRKQSLSMAGFGVGLFDFNNDGWKDLFVTRGHVASLPQPGVSLDQPNTVFRNSGVSGRWQALTTEAGLDAAPPARHRGCAFGDLDGDGRVDVVVTALGKQAEIWMNRSNPPAHWLDVALEGVKSNRDGIGARIQMVRKSGKQFNHMTSSVGYASSSLGPVHFGLGSDPEIESMEIRWPSGVTQTLQNVKADRVVSLKESEK